jgi:large subunit ribosomal protein L15
MQIHQIRSNNKSSKKRRVGRGGKRGTYSGRGMKGQKSRAGRKIKSQLREMILKFPKRRGVSFPSLQKKSLVLKLSDIVRVFPEGGVIDLNKLKKIDLIRKIKGEIHPIKILGAIPLSKKYIIKGCLSSETVKEAIIKAGGTIDPKIK